MQQLAEGTLLQPSADKAEEKTPVRLPSTVQTKMLHASHVCHLPVTCDTMLPDVLISCWATRPLLPVRSCNSYSCVQLYSCTAVQ